MSLTQLHIVKLALTKRTCSNPCGVTMPVWRKQDLYAVCRKWNLLIVEDDPCMCTLTTLAPAPAYKQTVTFKSARTVLPRRPSRPSCLSTSTPASCDSTPCPRLSPLAHVSASSPDPGRCWNASCSVKKPWAPTPPDLAWPWSRVSCAPGEDTKGLRTTTCLISPVSASPSNLPCGAALTSSDLLGPLPRHG